MNEISTSDLYCAAFLFAERGALKEVKLSRKQQGYRAQFVFAGEDVAYLESLFTSGKATVDPLKFKFCLNYIKDVMFKELRNVRQ